MRNCRQRQSVRRAVRHAHCALNPVEGARRRAPPVARPYECLASSAPVADGLRSRPPGCAGTPGTPGVPRAPTVSNSWCQRCMSASVKPAPRMMATHLSFVIISFLLKARERCSRRRMARWWPRSVSISASMSTSRRSRIAAAPPPGWSRTARMAGEAEADLAVHADLLEAQPGPAPRTPGSCPPCAAGGAAARSTRSRAACCGSGRSAGRASTRSSSCCPQDQPVSRRQVKGMCRIVSRDLGRQGPRRDVHLHALTSVLHGPPSAERVPGRAALSIVMTRPSRLMRSRNAGSGGSMFRRRSPRVHRRPGRCRGVGRGLPGVPAARRTTRSSGRSSSSARTTTGS